MTMQGSWENSNSAFQETIRKAVSGSSFMFTVYPVQVELWAILDAHHVTWGSKIMIQKSRRVKTLTGFLIYPSSLKSNQTWLNTKIKDQLTYNYFISVNVKDSFRKGNSLFVLRRFCEHPCYFQIIEFNKMKINLLPLTSDYVEKYIISYKQFTTIFIHFTVRLDINTRNFVKRWVIRAVKLFTFCIYRRVTNWPRRSFLDQLTLQLLAFQENSKK